MKRFWGFILLAAALTVLGGCYGSVSKEVRAEVDPGVTFGALVQNPEAYRGRMVMFSGTIIRTLNKPTGTELVIVQHPSPPGGRPTSLDRSEGRFLAEDSRFLDEAIYAPGRQITAAGRVTGSTVRRLGEMDYTYPVIQAEELYLWRAPTRFDWGFFFGTSW
jgi:outer membrane lipoprotein